MCEDKRARPNRAIASTGALAYRDNLFRILFNNLECDKSSRVMRMREELINRELK